MMDIGLLWLVSSSCLELKRKGTIGNALTSGGFERRDDEVEVHGDWF